MRRQSWLSLVLVAFTACTLAQEQSQEDGPSQMAPRCTSGMLRSLNESEGPEMAPGRACNACHAEENAASGEGDAPIFAAAGTVFPTAHEPDDCIASASAGARVEVIDAVGRLFSAEVNRGGNFLLEEEHFTYPYRAKVVFQGRERMMEAPQSSGDCNSCHTASGSNGAPGRIVLP